MQCILVQYCCRNAFIYANPSTTVLLAGITLQYDRVVTTWMKSWIVLQSATSVTMGMVTAVEKARYGERYEERDWGEDQQ